MKDKDDLDYDDDDLEELDDDLGGEDFDDDFDDLEELEEENDATKPGIDAASFPGDDDLEQLDEEDEIDVAIEPQSTPASSPPRSIAEQDEDDAFFNTAADEDDDLSLGRAPPTVAEAVSPPPVKRKTTSIAEDFVRPVAKKGLQPVYFIPPILGILIGIGFFLLKPGKKQGRLLGPGPSVQQDTMTPAAPFIKPKIDETIPDDYVKLRTIEIRDSAKITSLVGRGLLKKNEQGKNLKLESLTLVLYQTEVRFVVLQTYHYADGTQWKVETQFSELVDDPEKVTRDFAKVYAGRNKGS